jgi:hypothetical protein
MVASVNLIGRILPSEVAVIIGQKTLSILRSVPDKAAIEESISLSELHETDLDVQSRAG